MKWRVLSSGKISFPWVRDGVAEYEKRMARFAPTELRALRNPTHADYAKASEGCWRVVLDERGETPDTEALCRLVSKWEAHGVKTVSVWIGGADGFPEQSRQEADVVLALGPLTLMHELALLVWMEQLYRVHTKLAGLPYHRA